MNSIRESVHDLHDDSVDLKQAVDETLKEMREKYLVSPEYDMSAAVPRNVKYCFITTVKETMSNIVKHSDADRICLVFREHPGLYQMTIEDNGTKAAYGGNRENGIDIGNMKERVDALNGSFRIKTEQGFSIFISIPKNRDGS